MRVALFGIVRFRGKAVLVLLVLCLFIFFVWQGVRDYNEKIMSLELISLSYPGQITIDREETWRTIREQLAKARVTKADEVNPAYRLILVNRKGLQTFVFREPGRLYDLRDAKVYVLKDGGKCLQAFIKQLDSMNPYGEFVPWSQADQIFPRYERARIIDFETGLSFMVQRRAGSNHADVQPLTAADSAVMKTIYGGKWSWRRRAIIVEVKGRRLAASMNGMPHGAGAISGNDFAGHFCIHFRDSKTHASGADLAHQLMICKAAGKVGEMLTGLKPAQVTRVMLTALEQDDPDLAAAMFTASPDLPESEIRQQLRKISWLAVSKISQTEKSQANPDQSAAELSLTVSYGLTDGSRNQNRKITLTLSQDTQTGIWKIDPACLDSILADPAMNSEFQDDPTEPVDQDWYVDKSM